MPSTDLTEGLDQLGQQDLLDPLEIDMAMKLSLLITKMKASNNTLDLITPRIIITILALNGLLTITRMTPSMRIQLTILVTRLATRLEIRLEIRLAIRLEIMPEETQRKLKNQRNPMAGSVLLSSTPHPTFHTKQHPLPSMFTASAL